jgi:S-adenosylmethionine synthetase
MSYSFGPKAVRKGALKIYTQRPTWDDKFETIERKGTGHPDSIADELASRISRAYAQYTFLNCDGLVLHHQVDKLMMIGGREKVYFGGGEVLQPVRVIVAGRATYSYSERTIPVDDIVRDTIGRFFSSNYPMLNLDRDVIVENWLTNYPSPGAITTTSGAAARMFDPRSRLEVRGYEKYVANDTSCCVAYYPYSPLENAVLGLSSFLDSSELKSKHPWLGSDIKIMATRDGDRVDLTMCIPQISTHVPTLNAYWRNLDAIGTQIDDFLKAAAPGLTFDICINTKDDYERFNVYMTFTGASLSGDIGAVGRGNRLNGLITSNRPMSVEASAGKNPRYYSGFIYAVLSERISKGIYDQFGEASIVEIVSQNGGDLPDPWRARIVTAADPDRIRHLYQDFLKTTANITADFLKG